MSRQVDQHSTLNQSESNTPDESALAAMKHIDSHEVQPKINIKESELTLLMNQCLIDRNHAMDLIIETKGNLDEALRLYVHQ
ncbi:hypothetical protein TRFO_39721 [Tritrichomonas foetus]|uniref:Nascent polypeptide-associated complex subunit alpha-like UBA domain-containing protein n=1 Tax=Tritrichomonas foetus TaxID=1144522 RepID=A0A1J4J3Z2_9EUKA|nr:hypothetical protein TRFO_39721 [Tritrichomonas foetus]|eukprot:OHS94082.1 hypothetical protein TRFO_39721 [Tritrichomonas foetus]